MMKTKKISQAVPKNDKEYSKLLQTALQDLMQQNQKLNAEYDFLQYKNFSVCQDTSTVLFRNEQNEIQCIVDVSFVGSYAVESNTWHWAWSNEAIEERCYEYLLPLQEFGKQGEITDLMENDWACEVNEAWAVAALAWYLLGGLGVFCAETSKGKLFLLMQEVNPISA